MDTLAGTRLVSAAQAGDRQALAALLAEHLPLVYNVVGRALGGHSDVDDVVQETMLRAVQGLPTLREPDRFRAWLISVAIRQVQERGRGRASTLARQTSLEEQAEPVDPGVDVLGTTITRIGLAAQRRDVAEAARWLSPSDQRLLALWWQEVAGTLTRPELAAGLGLSQPHAAVRVQRMKTHLDLARSVLRAWRTTPRCAELTVAGQGWGGQFDPTWLKRLGRHVRGCDRCLAAGGPLIPAERLLTGATLPLPALLADRLADLLAGGGMTIAPATAGLRRLVEFATVKSAATTGAAVVGAAAVALTVSHLPGGPAERTVVAPSPSSSVLAPVTAGPTAAPTATPVPTSAPAQAPLTGVARADLYVAPDGDDANPGTLDAPFATLGRAAAVVQPGQTIALRGGVYQPTVPVTITTSGTSSARITLSNYRDEKPVIDASRIRSNQWYITHRGSYWTVQGLEVRGSPTFPYVCVSCQADVFRRLTMHDNGATGLVLRGAGTVGNQVVDSDFHDNHDDAGHGANADGVAFKDGSGAGNVVRGCRAFRNADDGVDLSGFADAVAIEHTWAFGNGVNRWGIAAFAGGGAGFRLGGGDPVPAADHVVTDNAAWDNAGYGFTEQNNPGSITVVNNTAYRNAKDGFAFWYSPSLLRANLSLGNARDDNRGTVTTESANSWQEPGWSVAALRSVDPATAEGPRPADGALPATAFLAPDRPGAGARMTAP